MVGVWRLFPRSRGVVTPSLLSTFHGDLIQMIEYHFVIDFYGFLLTRLRFTVSSQGPGFPSRPLARDARSFA